MRWGSEEALGESGEAARHFTALGLKTNFAWTLAGNVIYAACQWAMLAVLTRLAAPDAVGRFALGLAVTAPVFMLTGLQLRAVQATDARADYRFGDYVAVRLATTILAVAALAVIAAFGYPGRSAWVICAVGAAKAIESMSDVFYGLLQQHERMDRIAISMGLRATLSLAAFALVLIATRSLFWGVVAMAGVWAAVLASYDIRSGLLIAGTRSSWGSVLPRWDASTMRQLMLLSLPLGVVMMFVSLNTNIPRYVIDSRLGESSLGLFAAVAAIFVAGNTVVSALGQSASPRLAKHYAAGERRAFAGLLARLLVIGLLLGCAGVVTVLACGPWLLGTLYGPQYAGQTPLFLWIAAAAGVSYAQSFVGYAVTAARYFRVQAPLSAIVALATAGFSLWLISARGLPGAGMALAAASAVHLAGNSTVLAHALSRMPSAREAPILERA